MLQCGRCLGYLRPHNSRGRNVAVPALVLVFSLRISTTEGKNNNTRDSLSCPVFLGNILYVIELLFTYAFIRNKMTMSSCVILRPFVVCGFEGELWTEDHPTDAPVLPSSVLPSSDGGTRRSRMVAGVIRLHITDLQTGWLANSAFHPFGVDKWVVIHVITWVGAIKMVDQDCLWTCGR